MDGILRGATSRSRNVALRVFYYARSSARVMVTVRVEPLPYTMHEQQRFVVTSGEEGRKREREKMALAEDFGRVVSTAASDV